MLSCCSDSSRFPACHAEDERLRLRAQYEARIKALDGKVRAVAAKERRLVELEAMKRKVGRGAEPLSEENGGCMTGWRIWW